MCVCVPTDAARTRAVGELRIFSDAAAHSLSQIPFPELSSFIFPVHRKGNLDTDYSNLISQTHVLFINLVVPGWYLRPFC